MNCKYRRRIGRYENWHFHPGCPDWPEADYTERAATPPARELCVQCIDLDLEDGADPAPGRD